MPWLASPEPPPDLRAEQQRASGRPDVHSVWEFGSHEFVKQKHVRFQDHVAPSNDGTSPASAGSVCDVATPVDDVASPVDDVTTPGDVAQHWPLGDSLQDTSHCHGPRIQCCPEPPRLSQQDDGATEKAYTGVDWCRQFSSELVAMHASLAQLAKEQRTLAVQEVVAELAPRLRADKASMLRAIRELLCEQKRCERCHGLEVVPRVSDRTTRKETAQSRFLKPVTAYAKTTQRTTMRTEMYQALKDISTPCEQTVSDFVSEHEPSNRSKQFIERISMAVVLFYICFIGIEAELSMRSLQTDAEPSTALWWISLLFTTVFTLEVAARMVLEREDYWLGPHRWWNYLDILLIIGSWIDIWFSFVSLRKARAVRVFQAFRAAKMLRAFRFFRKLRQMVAAILCSLSSLAWALGLLCFLLYMFAVVIIQGVHAYLSHTSASAQEEAELGNYYGSLGTTMFSLFLAISGGKDWVDLVSPLRGFSKAYAAIFVFYVGFTLFGILNILTAIFVESASEISSIDSDLVVQQHQERDRRCIASIRRRFMDVALSAQLNRFKDDDEDSVDEDITAILTRESFEQHLEEGYVLGYVKSMGLDELQVRSLFELLETDSLGVDVDEFVCALVRLRSCAKGIDVATLMYENKRLATQIFALTRSVEEHFSSLGLSIAQLAAQARSKEVATTV